MTIQVSSKTIAELLGEIDRLTEVLEEVRELIQGYMDVKDGDYGVPEANDAMKAVQRIDEVLGCAR